jgi:PAS domain-containing protein
MRCGLAKAYSVLVREMGRRQQARRGGWGARCHRLPSRQRFLRSPRLLLALATRPGLGSCCFRPADCPCILLDPSCLDRLRAPAPRSTIQVDFLDVRRIHHRLRVDPCGGVGDTVAALLWRAGPDQGLDRPRLRGNGGRDLALDSEGSGAPQSSTAPGREQSTAGRDLTARECRRSVTTSKRRARAANRELAATNQQLLREIAERERAETELRRAFAILDHHVNNTPLGVIEWQQDYAGGKPARVRRWSGRAQAIFGWEGSEVLGRSAKEFGLVYEGDAVRAADAASELTESRRPYNSVSLRCCTKDGKVRHCQVQLGTS